MPSSKEFEEYAQDCIRLAEQSKSPELRDQFLELAREWMMAALDEQDELPPPRITLN
jgi:hypothetical protein